MKESAGTRRPQVGGILRDFQSEIVGVISDLTLYNANNLSTCSGADTSQK